MSLFTSLGRRAERVKQKFTDDTAYQCQDCETVLEEETACPNCGSDDIAAVETE